MFVLAGAISVLTQDALAAFSDAEADDCARFAS